MQDYTQKNIDNKNVGFFKTLIACLDAQKWFLGAIAFVYFAVYAGLFAFYGADFGYLSGINDTVPNVPSLVLHIIDKTPQFGIGLIVTYITFALHLRYMRSDGHDGLFLLRSFENHDAFGFFAKQYALSFLFMLFLCMLSFPLLLMSSYIANAIAILWIILVIAILITKPYVSLYYNKGVGVIALYKIMKSVTIPYVIAFIATVAFILGCAILLVLSGQALLVSLPINSAFIMVVFDLLSAFLIVFTMVLMAFTPAHFAYKAISKFISHES